MAKKWLHFFDCANVWQEEKGWCDTRETEHCGAFMALRSYGMDEMGRENFSFRFSVLHFFCFSSFFILTPIVGKNKTGFSVDVSR